MAQQYLDKTGLSYFWGKIKSFVIKENTKIPFAKVDSTSTSKIYTATVPEITELVDGVCLYLMNGVVTSESGFTLNVNGLGAKPVYSTLSAASRATTLFNVNYTLFLVYNTKRVTNGCWDAYYGYDSNTNTIGYQLRTVSTSLPMKSITYRYRLLFTSADREHFVPATNSSSTNATSSRTVCQDAIDPFGEIRYYGTTASVAAGARPAVANLWEQYGITLGYSFNKTGAALVLTQWKPVYVKCAPQSDGSAIIDADTPYVQTLPTTDDGKIYIFLGVAYSDTQVELVVNHPVYWYKDGMIRPYTNTSIAPVTSVNGQTGAVSLTTADIQNTSGFITMDAISEKSLDLIVADSTAQSAFSLFGGNPEIRVPSYYDLTGLGFLALMYNQKNPWFYIGWMNGTEAEINRLCISFNVSTNPTTVTLYARGRTSIISGVAGVDNSWTVTPLASDAEGVAY